MKILLKEVRRRKGVSINELGRMTGRSPQYLSKLEAGAANPSLKVIDELCGALECQPGDLLRYIAIEVEGEG